LTLFNSIELSLLFILFNNGNLDVSNSLKLSRLIQDSLLYAPLAIFKDRFCLSLLMIKYRCLAIMLWFSPKGTVEPGDYFESLLVESLSVLDVCSMSLILNYGLKSITDCLRRLNFLFSYKSPVSSDSECEELCDSFFGVLFSGELEKVMLWLLSFSNILTFFFVTGID
jgi:hypothetical protein